jgi:hypothetical protein
MIVKANKAVVATSALAVLSVQCLRNGIIGDWLFSPLGHIPIGFSGPGSHRALSAANRCILRPSSHTPSAAPAMGDGSCATRHTFRKPGMTPGFLQSNGSRSQSDEYPGRSKRPGLAAAN